MPLKNQLKFHLQKKQLIKHATCLLSPGIYFFQASTCEYLTILYVRLHTYIWQFQFYLHFYDILMTHISDRANGNIFHTAAVADAAAAAADELPLPSCSRMFKCGYGVILLCTFRYVSRQIRNMLS